MVGASSITSLIKLILIENRGAYHYDALCKRFSQLLEQVLVLRVEVLQVQILHQHGCQMEEVTCTPTYTKLIATCNYS